MRMAKMTKNKSSKQFLSQLFDQKNFRLSTVVLTQRGNSPYFIFILNAIFWWGPSILIKTTQLQYIIEKDKTIIAY